MEKCRGHVLQVIISHVLQPSGHMAIGHALHQTIIHVLQEMILQLLHVLKGVSEMVMSHKRLEGMS